ncbi:hypothetical protein CARUB_v10009479mg [Capsella rubella]|uniref:Electron transfer flavoprotein subunit alpha n=1 Tax=Capsella rubella TaxID=81985 RepID=R0IHX6_9BRAS|nr:hypothetical protein CARUB_v10009479mg [Capsella rubella]
MLLDPSPSPSPSPTSLDATLILAEHESGSIKPQTVSTVVAANSLGENSSISLLLAGSGSSLQEAAAQAASCHPSVSEVLVADSDKFEYPLAEPWAKLVEFVRQQGDYSHILASSSSFGKNILPRVAALLDVSPITDVVKILESNQFIRPIYAGNALSTVRYTGGGPCMLTIRSTSFPVTPITVDSESRKATISQIDLSNFKEGSFTFLLCIPILNFSFFFKKLSFPFPIADSASKSRYVGCSTQDTERPDLGSARVVITGGRALKSVENFKMIEKLAEKLGGAVGATRAAVDAGYVPNDLQVGQTGKIVAPELYMAFGVSGAIQHLAGIKDSKVIVAVNKDADAPIFQVADYGLVGDLFEVIPELLEKLPEKK